MREPTINFHRVGRQSLTSLKLRRLFDIYRIEKQNLIELELRFLSFKHHYFDPVYYLFSMNFMTSRQLSYEYKKSARVKTAKQKQCYHLPPITGCLILKRVILNGSEGYKD